MDFLPGVPQGHESLVPLLTAHAASSRDLSPASPLVSKHQQSPALPASSRQDADESPAATEDMVP